MGSFLDLRHLVEPRENAGGSDKEVLQNQMSAVCKLIA